MSRRVALATLAGLALTLPPVLTAWFATAAWPRGRAYPGRNGLIAFVRDVPPCPTGLFNCKEVIATMRPDGSDERHLTKGPVDEHPTWSPGGKRLAYFHVVHYGNINDLLALIVMNANGNGRRTLVKSVPAAFPNPRFDHLDWLDNRRIVFQSHSRRLCGGASNCLRVVGATGGPIKILVRLPKYADIWAAHGRRVAYVLAAGSHQGLYVMNVDGSGKRLVAPGIGDLEPMIDWSPDGREIVFATDNKNVGVYEPYTVDVASGEIHEVPGSPWGLSFGAVTEVGWSPDDGEFIFTMDFPLSGFAVIPSGGGPGSFISASSDDCGPGDVANTPVPCPAYNASWQPVRP